MDINPLNYSISKLNSLELSVGRLLVAEPFMQDEHFKRSVILICEHNEQGTVGLVLNRAVGLNINDLIKDFPIINSEVLIGGPVQAENLYYIHNKGELIPNSRKVAENVYWAGDFEAVKSLIATKKISASDIHFFLGYAGWDVDQIKDEIKGESWLITDLSEKYIFGDIDPDDLWAKILKDKGHQYAMMANFPENPSFN